MSHSHRHGAVATGHSSTQVSQKSISEEVEQLQLTQMEPLGEIFALVRNQQYQGWLELFDLA